jgi:hypothetical protein
MITSTSSADRTLRPELPVVLPKTGERLRSASTDQISTENAEFLRAELKRQPEIRPEVVARARELAADPSYPPREALRSIAEQILGSPDLSEDNS